MRADVQHRRNSDVDVAVNVVLHFLTGRVVVKTLKSLNPGRRRFSDRIEQHRRSDHTQEAYALACDHPPTNAWGDSP